MSEEARIRDAQAVKQELPMAMRAFDALEQDIMRKWADMVKAEDREDAWQRLRGLRDVRTMMVAAAAQADLSAHVEDLKAQGF